MIVALGLAVAPAAAGCTGEEPPAGAAGGAASPSAGAAEAASGGDGCQAVRAEPLPEWARAGFSGDATVPHVLGERGDIVAVLFGRTLHQPPLPDRNNKILWVSRAPVQPADRLLIDARLDGTGKPVSREVAGGPGPSIIDLPEPGCWHLTLRWSDRTDALRLAYLPG